jgi:hypothetical protein
MNPSAVWTAIGAGGLGAVLGGAAAGYLAAKGAVPPGCSLKTFVDGVFSYSCIGDPFRFQAVPADAYARWMLAGALPGLGATAYNFFKNV